MEMSVTFAGAGALSGPPGFVRVGANEIAFWRVGHGPALLLVHGYPVSGRTWRHVVARLADRFTCIIPDLPGAGETRWSAATAFGFAAQAETLKGFVDALGLTAYRAMAHDTGATIARRLATLDTARLERLVMIGTEIPGHRPPWIPLYQKISRPERTGLTRFLFTQRWFLRSSAGLGGCFHDKALIEGEFKALFLDPVVASARRAEGLTRYLLGIDWAIVDGMGAEHARITMPTLLIWGEDDPVFPVARARAIAQQLPDCRGFVTVPKAKLFVHEERPEAVVEIAGRFLAGE